MVVVSCCNISSDGPCVSCDASLIKVNGIFHFSSLHVVQVQQVTRVAQRHCQCPSSKCNKLKVKKVGEGRYNIAGRNVFIRVSIIEL
jgi:hypothetical protein